MAIQQNLKAKKKTPSLIVRVKTKGQVTIPVRVRRDLGLEEGDYIEVQKSGRSITITPKNVVDRHPEIDAAIAEGLKDVREGRMTPPFRSVKELMKYLKTHSPDEI